MSKICKAAAEEIGDSLALVIAAARKAGISDTEIDALIDKAWNQFSAGYPPETVAEIRAMAMEHAARTTKKPEPMQAYSRVVIPENPTTLH